MAFQHLYESLTRENLWLYILTLLKERPTYPLNLKRRFHERFSFSPATITFYVVLYKLRREGLVETFAANGRKMYRCTAAGFAALERGLVLMEQVVASLRSAGAFPAPATRGARAEQK